MDRQSQALPPQAHSHWLSRPQTSWVRESYPLEDRSAVLLRPWDILGWLTTFLAQARGQEVSVSPSVMAYQVARSRMQGSRLKNELWLFLALAIGSWNPVAIWMG